MNVSLTAQHMYTEEVLGIIIDAGFKINYEYERELGTQDGFYDFSLEFPDAMIGISLDLSADLYELEYTNYNGGAITKRFPSSEEFINYLIEE